MIQNFHDYWAAMRSTYYEVIFFLIYNVWVLLTDWLKLFVDKFKLVKENATEVFHHYGFHLSSSLLM